MKLYAGDDLHSSNNYLAIIDETGKRAFKKKLAKRRMRGQISTSDKTEIMIRHMSRVETPLFPYA